MNYIEYVYTRQRRNFGRQCMFSDRNQLIYDQPSDYNRLYDYILRNPVNRGTQLSKKMGFSECNTENATYVHRGMQHNEGGWPKDVNFLDEEQTLRYRKKIEREDTWGKQVLELTKPTIHAVLQNNAVNVYQDYFVDIKNINLVDDYEAHEVKIFRDQHEEAPRTICNIAWHPIKNNILMGTYGSQKIYPSLEIPTQCYIWDIKNSNEPKATLTSPVLATKIEFCPKDANLIAGGLSNGGVAIWDYRKGKDPVGQSELETAHRRCVNALCFVHSKSNSEFYTGSIDGAIHYWDARDLNKPVISFLADPQKTDDQDRRRAHGITCLDFEYTIPIRFMAGTTHGYIFLGNRKGLVPTETLVANFKVLAGPVRSINRNPAYLKNFLVTGEWCAKIWTEDCKDNPLLRIRNHKTQINCGVWSNGRCSLFFTGQEDGTVELWDLIMDQHKPIYTMRSISSPITAMRADNTGKYLATGATNGNIHLIEMDKALRFNLPKERTLVSGIFERELRRVKLIEGRIREIKLKMTKEKRDIKEWDLPLHDDDEEGEMGDEEEVAETGEGPGESKEEEAGEGEGDEEFMAAHNKFVETITEEEARRVAKKFTVMAPTVFDPVTETDKEAYKPPPTLNFEPDEKKQIADLTKMLQEKKEKEKKEKMEKEKEAGKTEDEDPDVKENKNEDNVEEKKAE